MGEEAAYEVMSYVALDPEYLNSLIEVGYHDTFSLLRRRAHNPFMAQEEDTVISEKGTTLVGA